MCINYKRVNIITALTMVLPCAIGTLYWQPFYPSLIGLVAHVEVIIFVSTSCVKITHED